MRRYSRLFDCLYDEPEPIGDIGRGTHYSVMRSVQWVDGTGALLPASMLHDFAVVWDEDHDTRVIEAVERIHMAGLLAPILFVGERKGNLTVIVDFTRTGGARRVDRKPYRALIQETVDDICGDHWPVDDGAYDHRSQSFLGNGLGIVCTGEEVASIYLRNIHNLWRLGLKPYVRKPSPHDPIDFTDDSEQMETEAGPADD